MDALRYASNRERLDLAFRLAEEELGIKKLIDAEDVDVDKPEERSIMTYVALFLNKYPEYNASVPKDVLDSDKILKVVETYDILKRWMERAETVLEEKDKPIQNLDETLKSGNKFVVGKIQTSCICNWRSILNMSLYDIYRDVTVLELILRHIAKICPLLYVITDHQLPDKLTCRKVDMLNSELEENRNFITMLHSDTTIHEEEKKVLISRWERIESSCSWWTSYLYDLKNQLQYILEWTYKMESVLISQVRYLVDPSDNFQAKRDELEVHQNELSALETQLSSLQSKWITSEQNLEFFKSITDKISSIQSLLNILKSKYLYHLHKSHLTTYVVTTKQTVTSFMKPVSNQEEAEMSLFNYQFLVLRIISNFLLLLFKIQNSDCSVTAMWSDLSTIYPKLDVWLNQSESAIQLPFSEQANFFKELADWHALKERLNDSTTNGIPFCTVPTQNDLKKKLASVNDRWDKIFPQVHHFMLGEEILSMQVEITHTLEKVISWLDRIRKTLKSKFICTPDFIQDLRKQCMLLNSEAEELNISLKNNYSKAEYLGQSSDMFREFVEVNNNFLKEKDDLTVRLRICNQVLAFINSLNSGISECQPWLEEAETIISSHSSMLSYEQVQDHLGKHQSSDVRDIAQNNFFYKFASVKDLSEFISAINNFFFIREIPNGNILYSNLSFHSILINFIFFSRVPFYKALIDNLNRNHQELLETVSSILAVDCSSLDTQLYEINSKFMDITEACKHSEIQLESLVTIWKNYYKLEKFIEIWITQAKKYLEDKNEDSLDSQTKFFSSCSSEQIQLLSEAMKELTPSLSGEQIEKLEQTISSLRSQWQNVTQSYPSHLETLKCQQLESIILKLIKDGELQLQNEEYGFNTNENTESLIKQHKQHSEMKVFWIYPEIRIFIYFQLISGLTEITEMQIEGKRPRGRPRLTWMDNIKEWTNCSIHECSENKGFRMDIISSFVLASGFREESTEIHNIKGERVEGSNEIQTWINQAQNRERIPLSHSNYANEMNRYLEKFHQIIKENNKISPDDQNLFQAYDYLNELWKKVLEKIDSTYKMLIEVDKNIEDYNKRYEELSEWMHKVEKSMSEITFENVSVEEFESSLTKFKVSYFADLCNEIGEHREAIKWLITSLGSIIHRLNEEAAKLEKEKLEALHLRYKKLIPNIEIMVKHTETSSKCYSYREEVIEKTIELKKILSKNKLTKDENNENTVKESVIPLVMPKTISELEEMIEASEGLLKHLNDERAKTMATIQKGRTLEKLDKVPDFVTNMTDELESYWNEAQTKIVEKIHKLKAIKKPWSDYEKQKKEVIKLLQQAEQGLASIMDLSTSDSNPDELKVKQENFEKMKERTDTMLKELKDLEKAVVEKTSGDVQPFLEKEVVSIENQMHVVMTTMNERIVYLEQSNKKLTNYSIKLGDYIKWLQDAREQIKKLMSLPPSEIMEEAQNLATEIEHREAVLSLLESESSQLLEENPESQNIVEVNQRLTELKAVLTDLKHDLHGPSGIMKSVNQAQVVQENIKSLKGTLEATETVIADGIPCTASNEQFREKMQQMSELKTLCEVEEANVTTLVEEQPVEETVFKEDVKDVKNRLEKVKSTVDSWEKQLQEVTLMRDGISSKLTDIAESVHATEDFLQEDYTRNIFQKQTDVSGLQNQVAVLMDEIEDVFKVAPDVSSSLRQQAVDLRNNLNKCAEDIHSKLDSAFHQLHKADSVTEKMNQFENSLEDLENHLTALCEMKSDCGKLILAESRMSKMTEMWVRAIWCEDGTEEEGTIPSTSQWAHNVLKTLQKRQDTTLHLGCGNVANETSQEELLPTLLDRFKLIDSLLKSKMIFLQQWVEFYSWFKEINENIDDLSEALDRQPLTDEKLAAANGDVESLHKQFESWKTKILELPTHQKSAKMAIIDQDSLRPYNLENEIIGFREKINKLMMKGKEKVEEKKNVEVLMRKLKDLCNELHNWIGSEESSLDKIQLDSITLEKLQHNLDILNKCNEQVDVRQPNKKEIEELGNELINTYKKETDVKEVLSSVLVDIENLTSRVQNMKSLHESISSKWKLIKEIEEKLRHHLDDANSALDSDVDSVVNKVKLNEKIEVLQKNKECLKKETKVLEQCKDQIDGMMKKMSELPKSDAKTLMDFKEQLMSDWNSVVKDIDSKLKELESQVVLWKQIDVLTNEILSFLQDMISKLKNLKEEVKDEKKIEPLLEKCKLKQKLGKCDDIYGNDTDLINYFNSCEEMKNRASELDKEGAVLNEELQKLQHKYPQFETKVSEQDYNIISENSKTIKHQFEKISNKVLNALNNRYENKVDQILQTLKTLNGKIAWCNPNATSDKYSVDARISSISDLNSLMNDGEQKYNATHKMVELLTKFPGNDVRQAKFANVKKEWSTFMEKHDLYKQNLGRLSELWQDLEDSSESFLSWMKKIEEQVRKESFFQNNPHAISEQIELLENLQNEARHHENDVADLQAQANEILIISPDSKIENSSLKARYTTLCNNIQESISKLSDIAALQKEYSTALEDIKKWIKNFESKLSSHSDPKVEKEILQENIKKLEMLEQEKPTGQELMNVAVSKAEALCPSISVEERENVRSDVRKLRDEWDSISKDLKDIRKALETSLIDWNSFDQTLDQVSSWLDHIKSQGNFENVLKPTLVEKKQLLHHIKAMEQDIKSHKNVLTRLGEEQQKLSNKDTLKKVSNLNAQYESLCHEIQQGLLANESRVNNQDLYNQSTEKLSDRVKHLKNDLKTIMSNDNSVELDDIQSKIDTTQNIFEQKKQCINELKYLEDELTNVKSETAPSGHPALQSDFDTLSNDVNSVFTTCEMYNKSLLDSSSNLNKIDEGIKSLGKWISAMESQLKENPLRSDAASKKKLLTKFRDLNKDILKKKQGIDEIYEILNNMNGESTRKMQMAQFSTQYHCICNSAKDLVNKWSENVKDHENYNLMKNDCISKLEKLEQQCEDNSNTKRKQDQLQVQKTCLENLKDENNVIKNDISRLFDCGEKLYPHTSSDGREDIRQELKSIGERWQQLSDRLASSINNLESCLFQLAQNLLGQEKLCKWFDEMNKAMAQNQGKKSTLMEKKAQLADQEALVQRIFAHKPEIDQIIEEIRSANHLDDSSVAECVVDLQQQCDELTQMAEDLLKQVKEEVDIYEHFEELCHDFSEKLQFFHEKFSDCKDVKGDKQSVQTRYDTYKSMKENMVDLEEKLKIIKSKFVELDSITNTHGQDHTKRTVESLEQDYGNLKSEVFNIGCNMENVLQQWKSYENNVNTLLKWFSETDTLMKDPQELCLTIEEKKAKLEIAEELEKNIIDYETKIDQFSDQSHALLHWSGNQQVKNKISQLNSRYQQLKQNIRDLVTKCTTIASDHKDYVTLLEKFTNIINNHEIQLEEIKDIKNIEDKDLRLSDLLSEQESGNRVLSNLLENGEKVLVCTASAGRDTIRKDLKNLQRHWEDLGANLSDMKKQSESKQAMWSTFTDLSNQVSVTILSWLGNMKKCMDTKKEKPDSMHDARAKQRQFKILNQEIAAYKKIINTLEEQVMSLNNSEANQTMSNILKQYKSLVTHSNMLSKDSDEKLALVQKYQGLHKSFTDWQKDMWERASQNINRSGNKKTLQNSLSKVEELDKNRPEGEMMLIEVSNCINELKEKFPQHDSDVLDQDLESLKNDSNRFSSHIKDVEHELQEKLKQWKNYYDLFYKLIAWLSQKESLLKDYCPEEYTGRERATTLHIPGERSLLQEVEEEHKNLQDLQAFGTTLEKVMNPIGYHRQTSEDDSGSDQPRSLDDSQSSSKDLPSAVSQICTRYQTLLLTAKDIVKKSKHHHQDHELFENCQSKCVEALNSVEQQCGEIIKLKGNTQQLQTCLQKIDNIVAGKRVTTMLLHELIETAEKTNQNTMPEGQKEINEQVEKLQQMSTSLYEQILNIASDLKTKADNIKKLNMAITEEKDWLNRLNKQLGKDDGQYLKATLDEKKLQMQTYRVIIFC
ncbi:Nesprin-1 [Nymphon striatum]|nr:Nesprin-1 [Nymphon striatum]